MTYWANFAKTGNPSLGDKGTWESTYWPLHTPLKRETLTPSSSSAEVIEGHGVRKCAFWKRFLPQLGDGKFDGRYGDFFYNNLRVTGYANVPSGSDFCPSWAMAS